MVWFGLGKKAAPPVTAAAAASPMPASPPASPPSPLLMGAPGGSPGPASPLSGFKTAATATAGEGAGKNGLGVFPTMAVRGPVATVGTGNALAESNIYTNFLSTNEAPVMFNVKTGKFKISISRKAGIAGPALTGCGKTADEIKGDFDTVLRGIKQSINDEVAKQAAIKASNKATENVTANATRKAKIKQLESDIRRAQQKIAAGNGSQKLNSTFRSSLLNRRTYEQYKAEKRRELIKLVNERRAMVPGLAPLMESVTDEELKAEMDNERVKAARTELKTAAGTTAAAQQAAITTASGTASALPTRSMLGALMGKPKIPGTGGSRKHRKASRKNRKSHKASRKNRKSRKASRKNY